MKGLMAALVLGLVFSHQIHAQEGGGDLRRCLISSATAEDKTTLYLLTVAGMAQHPAAKTVIAVNEEGYESLLKKYAVSYKRLVYVECRKAIVESAGKNGAQATMTALNQTFGELGQLAGQPMLEHPAVMGALMQMMKYFDENERQAMIKEMMAAIDKSRASPAR